MNTTRLVSLLLVLLAVVVLVVALVVFFQRKNESSTAAATGPDQTMAAAAAGSKVLNVVTHLPDDRVEQLKAGLGQSFLLDARVKGPAYSFQNAVYTMVSADKSASGHVQHNYTFSKVTVNVAAAEPEEHPGYTTYTHTFATPFKGHELVFDGGARYPFFEGAVAAMTAYWWNTTLLFLTFRAVDSAGRNTYFYFTGHPVEDGLRWSKLEHDPALPLEAALLATRLDELNSGFGNAVVLNLDEFLEESSGSYNTEVGGVTSTFALTKRPFTQAKFLKLTHKLVAPGTTTAKMFKLRKVLVSGTELTDLVLPKKPVLLVTVYWWFNMPLLAELDLLGNVKEHFVYNLDSNNWDNEPVDKVRTKLNVLKNKLGVPLTLDLGKLPGANETDVSYTTNDVVVRVSAGEASALTVFPHFTHRFSTGNSHFVGSFVKSGTVQNGLPVVRVNEVSVYFSDDVPLLVKFNLAGRGALAGRNSYYSNNGSGFWSRVVLTEHLPNTDAVLKKLDAENKKLVAANDKYHLDVAMKSDYLTVGKLVKVAEETNTGLTGFTVFTHKAKNNVAFKFEKFVAVGTDLVATGVEPVAGVTSAKVYWFLDTPLVVNLAGNVAPPAALPPVTPVVPGVTAFTPQLNPVAPNNVTPVNAGAPAGAAPGVAGQPGAAGNVAPAAAQPANVLPAAAPLASSAAAATPFNHFFAYDAATKQWGRVDPSTVDTTTEKLKVLLNKTRATLGSVTLDVGQSAGTYKHGAFTVTVKNATPYDANAPPLFDKMVHELTVPFPVGKVKHFDFDLKLTELRAATNTGAGAGTQGAGEAAAQAAAKTEVLVGLPDLAVKKMEVHVFKYVPLLFVVHYDNGTTHTFKNTFEASKWVLFTLAGETTLDATLNELRNQLVAVSSVDVCVKHTADEPATYQLPTAAGTTTVPVTVSKVQAPADGLVGVAHRLGTPNVKLGSLTCGKDLLTGLDLDHVETVSVYFKGDVPALVKTNSKAKYFYNSGRGTLTRHTVPEGTADLNATQVAELATSVSNNLGPVLVFNLDAKNDYSAGAATMKVTAKTLADDFVLNTHVLGDDALNFTVSRFLKAGTEVTGLPANKLVNTVVVGFKGDVPLVLGLKLLNPVKFEWHVFDKHRWLADFETEEMLEEDDLLDLLKDVEDGLDNEFLLELSPEVHHEAFDLESHDFTEAEGLFGFAHNTYVPTGSKYPVLLAGLTFNAKALTVPELNTKHLNAFSVYTLGGRPVLLHAFTMDKLSLWYETDFSAWAPAHLADATFETLKAKLLALKAKGAAFVNLELVARHGYRNNGSLVGVAATAAAGTENNLAPFKEWTHTVAGAGANAAATPFKVTGVHFNGVPVDLVLPAGTVPNAKVFLNADGVPLGLYLHATETVTTTPAVDPNAQAAAAPTTQTVVTHNYFFNNAGAWAKLAETNAVLDNAALKEKLAAAEKSLGFHVELDLAKKLPYVFTREETVTTTGENGQTTNNKVTKTLDLLVEPALKDTYRFKTYTHFPKVRVEKEGKTTTEDFAPFVPFFTLNGQRLHGLDLAKVTRATVFWHEDAFPLLVRVTTPANTKFFRNAGDNNWVLLKVATEALTDVELFALLTLAKRGFAHEVNLELGPEHVRGYWYKYRTNALTVKVANLGAFGGHFKQFVHTSASAFAPTFTVNRLLLWGHAAFLPFDLGFVKEVRVFTNANDLPLLVEVAGSKFNTAKALLKYNYFTLDPDYGSNWALRHALFSKTRLPEDELVKMLEPMKPFVDTTYYVNLDKTEEYVTKGDEKFGVALVTTSTGGDEQYTVYKHTLNGDATKLKKTLLLTVAGKRVGFATRKFGFKEVEVFWHNNAPVFAKLTYYTAAAPTPPTTGGEAARATGWLQYVLLPGGKWADLGLVDKNFNFESRAELFKKLAVVHEKHTLDLGEKTLALPFGQPLNLDLVEFNYDNFKLPNDVVAYSLLPHNNNGFLLGKVTLFGLDFDHWKLPLPEDKVFFANVFSPDVFYAPVLLELVSKHVVLADAKEGTQKEVKETKWLYHYYYAASTGNWTFFHTEGKRLDVAQLSLKLGDLVLPSPVALDLARKTGVYGLHAVTVEKTPFVAGDKYTRYEHKLANTDAFLVARWAFGGVVVENLPVLKALVVAVYFYLDTVPLLLEVNLPGSVKFFSVDAEFNWLADVVPKAAVASFLDYMVQDFTNLARLSGEWVPHLNTRLPWEFELVPETEVPKTAEPAAKEAAADSTASTAPATPTAGPAAAPAAVTPAEGANAEQGAGGAGTAVTGANNTQATGAAVNAAGTDGTVAAGGQAGPQTGQQPAVPPGVQPAEVTTPKVVAPEKVQAETTAATLADHGTRASTLSTTGGVASNVLTSGTTPVTTTVERPATAPATTTAETTATGGDAANAQTGGTTTQATGDADTAQAAAGTTLTQAAEPVSRVPAVQPNAAAAGVVGASGNVAPLVPEPLPRRPRKFRLVPVNYEWLFNGYLTLGKFVKVELFDKLPVGYAFANHKFLKDETYFANRFLVGKKLYELPAEHVTGDANQRKVKTLGFYSWANNPLLVKLGFEGKSPVYFAHDHTHNNWKQHTVVNLDEELEHLNSLRGAFVFDLAAANGRHDYFDSKSYYVSDGPKLDANRFRTAEFEAFLKVKTKTAASAGVEEVKHDEFRKLPFNLGKLRFNGVDLPAAGLPVGKAFHTMFAFTSKALNKPLLLAFYDREDEKEWKKLEAADPNLYLGFYYHANLDGTWSAFLPKGPGALAKKLDELEPLFAGNAVLDLAKFPGPTGVLNYKTANGNFVVERVFVSPPKKVVEPPALTDEHGGVPDTETTSGGAAAPAAAPAAPVATPTPASTPVAGAQGVPAFGVTDASGVVYDPSTGLPLGATKVSRKKDTEADAAPGGAAAAPGTGVTAPGAGNANRAPATTNTPVTGQPQEATNNLQGTTQTGTVAPNTTVGTTSAGQVTTTVTPTTTTQATTTPTTQTVAGGHTGAVAGPGAQPNVSGTNPQGTVVAPAVAVPGPTGTAAQPAPANAAVTHTTGTVGTPAGAAQAASPAPANPTAQHTVGPEPTAARVVAAGTVDPVAKAATVTALETGATYVDVPLVAYTPPALEPELGFELFHHHAPYVVHSYTETVTPAEGGAATTVARKVVKAKKFALKKLLNAGVELDFAAPFEPLAGGWAGLTVLHQKNMATPFAFALFNPKNNSGDLANAAYDFWVLKNGKWLKTAEVEAFYGLLRAVELRHDLAAFDELLPAFSAKLAELAAGVKAALPNVFTVDLSQDGAVKNGAVAVEKTEAAVAGVALLKRVLTPRLLAPTTGWVDFTLDKVVLYGHRFHGLHLPLVGVLAVHVYFRTAPEKVKKVPLVLELVQNLRVNGKAELKHWYYGYTGANEWRLLFTTFNTLAGHDVFDLANALLYEHHRVAALNKNALVLDLDTKFSHLNVGRFVDTVAFLHDPNSTETPVPEGFVLYRHSMVTENTTFLLPHVKLHGLMKATGFKWPFVQYFVYYKLGHPEPFVFVLAQTDAVNKTPTHHWYFVKDNGYVKFSMGNTDVDPDAKASKAAVAAKFKELLTKAPEAVGTDDLTVEAAENAAKPVPPVFPATDNTVLAKALNGVVAKPAVPASAERPAADAPAGTDVGGAEGAGVVTEPRGAEPGAAGVGADGQPGRAGTENQTSNQGGTQDNASPVSGSGSPGTTTEKSSTLDDYFSVGEGGDSFF